MPRTAKQKARDRARQLGAGLELDLAKTLLPGETAHYVAEAKALILAHKPG